MDFDTVLKNLEKAGVPSEYVDMLEMAVSQLDQLGSSSAVETFPDDEYDYGYEDEYIIDFGDLPMDTQYAVQAIPQN